jgi:hypothetical protein
MEGGAGRRLDGVVFRFLCVLSLACAVHADPIEDAFQRLYNFDFAGTHRILDAHLKENPSDPLAYSTRAAAYLFFELDRLMILKNEFFLDDDQISGDDKLNPDAVIRERFFAAVDKAQELSMQRLEKNPGDLIGLFSFCMTEGMRTDYTAFVEKKQLRSLGAARRSHKYAVELIARYPEFVDSHLTTGLTEYLVGSLPFFIRWFVRFEHVRGSKEQAVINLNKVARDGRYLGPFARILLAVVHLREKRPHLAIELLEQLTQDFPENRLLREELIKLKQKHGPGGTKRR